MAVPPITVGELTNVPTPGSGVTSAWAQSVSNRVVHRFATVAARDAAWPAAAGNKGALCETLDTMTLWQSTGAAWRVLDEPWQTYTPTITAAGGGFAFGATAVQRGLYRRRGDTVDLGGFIMVGAAGFAAGSGVYTFSAPFPLFGVRSGSYGGQMWGHVTAYHASNGAAFAPARVVQPNAGASSFQVQYAGASPIGTNQLVGAALPWVWLQGDEIEFTFTAKLTATP